MALVVTELDAISCEYFVGKFGGCAFAFRKLNISGLPLCRLGDGCKNHTPKLIKSQKDRPNRMTN
jgi:hypothetical protein